MGILIIFAIEFNITLCKNVRNYVFAILLILAMCE